ncbi:unnamed protein product [Camellia sinensis]
MAPSYSQILQGLPMPPKRLAPREVIARMFYKVGSSYLLATGPLLCWRNAIYVKRSSLLDFFQNSSPISIYNDSDAKSKPRKRLIKKNTTVEESTPDFEIGKEDNGDELGDFVRGESDYNDAFFPCVKGAGGSGSGAITGCCCHWQLLVFCCNWMIIVLSIVEDLDKQYADVLLPLKENLTPKNFGLKYVQKLTKRSVCPYVVPDERMLDILRSKIEHQLKSWGSCIPDRGSTTSRERLSEVTVMLRTKFRNYLQAVVEKLAGNDHTRGHYVVICGYDAMTDEFEIRDPASSGKHEKVTSKRLEEARKSFGIDEDLLLYIFGEGRESEHPFGDLVTAGSLFNELSRTTLITWNAIIVGHVQNGLVEMGLSLCRQSGLTPDQYTFASVFRACATLATLQQGKQAKYFVVCLCIISCLYVAASMKKGADLEMNEVYAQMTLQPVPSIDLSSHIVRVYLTLKMTELCEYAANVDIPIARESIRAVGKIALQQCDVNAIVDRLLQFLEMEKDYVTAETLVLVKDLLRKYPQWSHDCIAVVGNISSKNVQEPKAKAALIWMLGEYCQDMQDAPYVLESLIDSWDDEHSAELTVAHLVDAHLCSDPGKYVSI